MCSEKISIIVPVYNSEGVLEKCIDSILAQTYNNFYLYLIDDASTDNSGKICDLYAKNDSRVKVIHHKDNKGLSMSREEGFSLCDTKWVSFIDNDDVVCENMFEQLIELGDSNNVELVCIRGEDKNDREILNHVWDKDEVSSYTLSGREACESVYSEKLDFPLLKPIWGKLIKRTLIEKAKKDVEPYKESLYWVFFEDVLFMPMVFYYANNVMFYNKLMYLHRRNSMNLSSSLQPKEFHYEAAEAEIVVLKFLEAKGLANAANRHLIGCTLNLQSIWYKVWKYEDDIEKKRRYNILVDNFINEYAKKLKKTIPQSFSDRVKLWNIDLFIFSRIIWGKTIGNMYFKILHNGKR